MVSGLRLRDVAAENDALRAERATSELFNMYFLMLTDPMKEQHHQCVHSLARCRKQVEHLFG